MLLNGWWRIAVVIMALIMGLILLSAFTGTTQVATASIPYDPPIPKGATDPVEAALMCGIECDRAAQSHKAAVQRLAMQLGQQSGCIKSTVRYEVRDRNIAVLCRTPDETFAMILHALIACAILLTAGLTIGWVAGGFRKSPRAP